MISEEKKAELVAIHYQNTYELTYEMWRQRNRLFLYLIFTLGVGALLSLNFKETNNIFVDLITKVLDINNEVRRNELYNSFPFALIQSIIMIVIFYLMVNLYHRAINILRNYKYLGALEKEIRNCMDLDSKQIAFTREGSFYWNKRDVMISSVKWVYILILGSLIVLFCFMRIYIDIRNRQFLLGIAELILSIFIFTYYFAYLRSSIILDNE